MEASTSDDHCRMESLCTSSVSAFRTFGGSNRPLLISTKRATVFVGANNSGKTSATHLFQLFLSQQPRAAFQIYDFTADCWETFNSSVSNKGHPVTNFPQITFDLWFNVDNDNLHRVLELLRGSIGKASPWAFAWSMGREMMASHFWPISQRRAPRRRKLLTERTRRSRAWPELDGRLPDEETATGVRDKVLRPRCKAMRWQFVPNDGYEPFFLGTHLSGASRILDSVIRVDFLHAQRHLTDLDSHGRSGIHRND